MGKISRSPRYVIDIIETNPLYLGELGGGRVNCEKLEKMIYFLTYEGVIRFS